MSEVEKSPFFSVIMPAYNVSLYIDDAIQSVLEQSFQRWELICVNDGSTDETLSKLNGWAAKNARIRVLNQQNSGAAKCRVNAIKHSTGEYISLLDSDDAWSPDMLQLCYEKILKDEVDCVIPNALMNFNSSNAATPEYLFDKYPRSMDTLISGKEAFSCTFPWQIARWFTIRGSIAKSLYVDDNISYSRYNNDEYLTRLLLLNCQRVGFCTGVYLYRVTNNSVTRKAFSKNRFDILKTNIKCYELAIANSIDKKTKQEIATSMANHLIEMGLYYNKYKNQLSFEDIKNIRLLLDQSYLYYKEKVSEKIYYKRKRKEVLIKFTLSSKFLYQILTHPSFLHKCKR